MGTKYTSQSVTGYNASPPSDAGAATEENRVTWAKIKSKLPDPLKTTLEAINSALVTAFDFGPISKGTNYTTLAGDHLKTVSCTAAITVSMMDASTAGAGYTVNVSNQSTGDVTIGRATPGDTINGSAADITVARGNSATLRVNSSANGYEVIETGMKDIAGLAKADGNLIVGDGTNWVAESGATARTSLGLGTAATQNTGTSGATVPLCNGNNTWGDIQVIGSGGASADMRVNGAAGTTRNVRFQSAASTRWAFSADGAAESGSNAGSDFLLGRYSDAAAFIEAAFSIRRTDGAMQIGVPAGGYKGNGTINAKGLYVDGVQVTSQGARAWVYFNGVTIAINDSYNVNSITDGGVGIYGVNFATAMTNTVYAGVASARSATPQRFVAGSNGDSRSTTQYTVRTFSDGGAAVDVEECNVVVFGD